MKRSTRVMLGMGAVAIICTGTAVIWYDREEKARQLVDTETVICLTQSLSPQEKQELAALSAQSTFHPLLAAYSRIFPRCVSSSGQWEREQKLTFNAWQILQGGDKEFRNMEDAIAGAALIGKAQ
jgi:hypothetical protein